MTRKQILALAVLLAFETMSLDTNAVNGQTFDISWYTIDCGGGPVSGGNFELDGTIGQHDAGPVMTGGSFELAGGFGASVVQGSVGDLIVNGSFESPDVPLGTFVSYVAGSQLIPGWDVVGIDVAIVDHFVQNGITFQAQHGNQEMDLSGEFSNDPNNGIVQSVTTKPGSNYQLNFFVGSATDGIFFFPSTVDLMIDGGPRTSYTNPNAPADSVDWLQFAVSFTAQNSVTTIAFLNGSGSNNFAVGLDNVSLIGNSEFLLGDVNGDGVVNLLDVTPFVDALITGTFIPEADINRDGVVNLLDVSPFVDLLIG